MNRKIFTLLAGAFLMLTMVFSAVAQSAGTRVHFNNPNPLKLGAPVEKLNAGANDYYHLVVTGVSAPRNLAPSPAMADPDDDDFVKWTFDDIIDYWTTALGGTGQLPIDPDDITPLVLYMGNELANKDFPLFIAPLGKASSTLGGWWTTADAGGAGNLPRAGWFAPNAPKSQESASSLWCTVVNPYDQGQNATFDFTNKYARNQLLEVDINGYEAWKPLSEYASYGGYVVDNYRSTQKASVVTPGSISGWNFSTKYATGVERVQPLFSYITPDTVAVLCVDIFEILDNIDNAANFTDGIQFRLDIGAYVVVKIASVKEVLANQVPGMLYFTLYEAAPFVLDALDINTMFGTENWGTQKLSFDPNVNPATGSNAIANPFTAGVFAQHIATNAAGNLGTLVFDTPDFFATKYGLGSTMQPIYTLQDDGCQFNNFDNPVDYVGSNSRVLGLINSYSITFDDLGYLYLKQGSADTDPYLYTKHEYYTGNAGGDKFLTFGYRTLQNGKTSPTENDLLTDVYLYGQSIWRLVYYPSGDSIYINPFQATYLPTWDAAMMKTAPESDGSAPGYGDKTLTWISELTQSENYYTFRANGWSLEDNASVAEMMESRLKYGKHEGCIDFYNYYHHNYVTIQTLTGNVRAVTLGNGSVRADHTIDTHIYFNVYDPCKEGVKSDRATVASDLYLIRSKVGNVEYFLNVPIFSATDSAIWTAYEPDIHPELLPSYQWAVLKRYENSDNSQITLYNREFDGTQFTIQLYNTTMTKFEIIGKDYWWNNKAVNHNATTLANHKGNAATFIALPEDIKKNSKLGYEYITRDDSQIKVFALNFTQGMDQNRYVDWKGDFWKYPNTDTLVYVTGQNFYDRLYFKLDTALNYGKLEKYGFKPDSYSYKIPYLVQLERQPYFLNFEDPYKLLCSNLFSMINGTQGEYAMGNKEAVNKSYLGTPIFNLRHMYHKEIDGKLVPYFALLQRLNKESYTSSTDLAAFTSYLTKNYNATVASEIIDQIKVNRGHTNNDHFKTGVFAAGVDPQTAKLKAVQRADEYTIAAAFRLVEDDDPIYRRFNTLLEADVADDTPKTLKFHWMDQPTYELFENTGLWPGQKLSWENYGIGTVKTEGKKNYLGSVNVLQYKDASTAIYVDTAFINRGTGPVKPQYLLVVDPKWPDASQACDPDGNFYDVYENYLRGRYLINATDSARGVAASGVGNNSLNATSEDIYGNPIGRSYLWDTNWERLVFTDAIHAYDYDALYLVSGKNLSSFMFPNSDVIDISLLDAASTTGALTTARHIRKIDLGNNNHKDAVFQMRLIERGSVEFIIESETGDAKNINNPSLNRKWGNSYGQLNSNGVMIAPCYGGWIKNQNGTAVISRSNVIDNMANGLRLDVKKTEDWPTANEGVAAVAPTVIGGNNAITILGAAGKKVVVSNVLGQTVAGVVLSSDNATISAPKGVVVVAIEGEAAVKTLVK